MNQNLTEIVFILDRSGSMAGMESDTAGGFNAMLRKQRKQPGQALISTVLFDHEAMVLHDRVPLDQVQDMDPFQVRGCTALLDALGGAIHHIKNVHKYAREEDRPIRTLFVITTDGLENASRRYCYQQVKAMIQRQQEQYGWEFLFLAANMDAAEEAGRFGIRRDHAVDYHCDAAGTAANYDAISEAISQVRSCRPLGTHWRAQADRDYQSRR